MKKIVLLIAFLLAIGLPLSFGQGSSLKTNVKLDVIPPPPTAAALGDFANINYDVKSYTGNTEISVPICTLNKHILKLPVYLRYNSRGIKINETPSWVGSGWSLEAGGVIVRTVKGQPDDFFWGVGKGFSNSAVSDSIRNISDANTVQNSHRIASIHDINPGVMQSADLEPDIFSFNFNGISGKFYFGEDRQIKLIPYRDVKISYTIDPQTKQFQQFSIIDENGTSYIFKDFESVSTATNWNVFVTTGINPANESGTAYQTTRTSWYLSKIILPDQEEVNFTYADENYAIKYPSNRTLRNCPDGDCEYSVNESIAMNYPNLASSETSATIAGKRLQKIETDQQEIDFVATNDRLDLLHTKALDSVKLYAKIKLDNFIFTKALIKGFKLTYDYNVGDNSHVDEYLNSTPGVVQNDYTRRLMLRSIFEFSAGLQALNSGHRFVYNESSTLGSRFSSEQDFWGYYNHNGAKTLVPKLYLYPQDYLQDQKVSIFQRTQFSGPELVLSGADRNVNPDYITLGALTKIIYPTGGYTQFDLEPNDFYLLNKNIRGGGLRLKRTVTFDGLDHARDIVKEYDYKQSSDPMKSSGRLISLPHFFYIENTHPYNDPTHEFTGAYDDPAHLIDCRNYSTSDYDYYRYFLTRMVEPRFCLAGSDGLDVGYKEVTEHLSGNGKTVYKFSLPGAYGQNSDSGEGCDITDEGYCDGLYSPTSSHYCDSWAFYNQFYNLYENTPPRFTNPDIKGMNFNYFYQFPFPPSTNYDWNRGFLISEKTYSAANSLLKEKLYQYQLYYPLGHTSPTYISGLALGKTENWQLDIYYVKNGIFSNAGSPTSDVYVFAKYKVLTEAAKVLKQLTTIDYDNSGHPHTLVENYKYNSFYHTNPTEKYWTDSRGNNWEEQYIYPSDLILTTTNTQPTKGYNLLKTSHINPIVWTRKLQYAGLNKNYVSGSITYYDSYNNSLLPSVEKKLQIDQPVGYTALADNTDGGYVSIDPRYKEEVSYQSYDDHDNLLSATTSDAPQQASIWGYNKQYLIANVKNAQSSEVAYTSFETRDESNSGWIFNNSFLEDHEDNPNAPSPLALTGKRAYTLGTNTAGITKTGLNPVKKYIVAFACFNGIPTITGGNVSLISNSPGAKMNYCMFEISNANAITITSSSAVIDELRFYPKEALMTSYTYDDVLGLTCIADEKGMVSYYEYDNFNRLRNIKDRNGNILKHYEYHYKNQ